MASLFWVDIYEYDVPIDVIAKGFILYTNRIAVNHRVIDLRIKQAQIILDLESN
jgi:hypothetical protein